MTHPSGYTSVIQSVRQPASWVTLCLALAGAAPLDASPGEHVFCESGLGLIVVEAEGFFSQSRHDKRAWYITSTTTRSPATLADIDPPHIEGTAGGAYIEVLPDTGIDGQKPVPGESISDEPGVMAVAHYRVNFARPGRYQIWARGFGFDGDDNTLHFGLDDTWPPTSARMHLYSGKRWQWASRHRQHQGRIHFEVATPGTHVVSISMREDGCELDRFILTTDETFTPPADQPGPEACTVVSDGAFVELDGVVVMEAEGGTPSGPSDWELVPTAGASGRGALQWDQPGQGRKATGAGTLTYRIRILSPGTYQLFLRARMSDPANRPDTLDPDGNDAWIRFDGGEDEPASVAFGAAHWSKVAILGHPSGWTWDTHADRGAPHPDAPVCRVYPKPGDYTFQIAGRSAGYRLDRIILRRTESSPVARLAPEDEVALDALPVSPRL